MNKQNHTATRGTGKNGTRNRKLTCRNYARIVSAITRAIRTWCATDGASVLQSLPYEAIDSNKFADWADSLFTNVFIHTRRDLAETVTSASVGKLVDALNRIRDVEAYVNQSCVEEGSLVYDLAVDTTLNAQSLAEELGSLY